MRPRRAPDGRALLHVWRTGTAYARRNEALFGREWTNVRHSVLPWPHEHHEYRLDVRRGLPFEPGTFDAVYAFHVVEHLDPDECAAFVGELRRVARPGAVVRLSTQDLEDMAREYLASLEQSVSDASNANLLRHRWSVLELIDQLTRERVGGLMLEALRAGEYDEAHLRRRFGEVADELVGYGAARPPAPAWVRLRHRIREGPRGLAISLARAWARWVTGNAPRATGEANRWLYDRLSLRRVMESRGLLDFTVQGHGTSAIPGWERYDFDSAATAGNALEPSIYVEARVPAREGAEGSPDPR